MTAVEWLVEHFDLEMQDDFYLTKIKQAKEMEKQQIEDAFYTEQIDEFGDEVTFEDYYNKTFKNS